MEMPEQIMGRVSAASSPQHDRGIIGLRNLTDNYLGSVGKETFRFSGLARRTRAFRFRHHCIGSTDLIFIRLGVRLGTLPRANARKRKDKHGRMAGIDSLHEHVSCCRNWEIPMQ